MNENLGEFKSFSWVKCGFYEGFKVQPKDTSLAISSYIREQLPELRAELWTKHGREDVLRFGNYPNALIKLSVHFTNDYVSFIVANYTNISIVDVIPYDDPDSLNAIVAAVRGAKIWVS